MRRWGGVAQGKSSVLEGGVRVSAFASGGMIPPAMRGKVLADPSQAIQLADWCKIVMLSSSCRAVRLAHPKRIPTADHTFCALAGVDYLDAPANLPDNTDSLDMWPLLSGKVTASPRTEVVIAIEGNTGGGHSPSGQYTPYNSSALIVGDFKAIFGISIGSAFWQGPDFPNASYTEWMSSMGKQWSAGSSEFCGTIDAGGCLFNIRVSATILLASGLHSSKSASNMFVAGRRIRPNTWTWPRRCPPNWRSSGRASRC